MPGPLENVTVLIPLRDEAANVPALVENLNVTAPSAEWVFVDDGSVDQTRELLMMLAPRATILDGGGRGTAAAMNVGLGQVDTEFVARADADDLSLPGRFEAQRNYLQEHPEFAACASAALTQFDDGPDLVVSPPEDPDVLRQTLLRVNPITNGATMMRTASLISVGGYDESFGAQEEFDLWLRLIQLGPIGGIPEVHYVRRAPSRSEFGRKRRKQSAASVRAKLRHWRQTGEISKRSVVRNAAAALWYGPRLSPHAAHVRFSKRIVKS